MFSCYPAAEGLAAGALALRQISHPVAEDTFQSGLVRVGWVDETLILQAELEDEDIFNPVTEDHVPSYAQGDVFEIFLRPEDQESYREFHINPNNARLQLRIPSAEAFIQAKQAGQGIPPEWFVRDRLITSEVKCEPDKNRWTVRAEIPFEMLSESGKPQIGDRWKFSFSRYDYTRGEVQPVLFSTSAHTEINFHQQQDWGTLEFCE